MLKKNESGDKNTKSIFTGLLISVIKIFLVFVVTLTFILYIASPPFSHAFFTHNAQSYTIVRTIQPV
jgi:hypothetical protein